MSNARSRHNRPATELDGHIAILNAQANTLYDLEQDKLQIMREVEAGQEKITALIAQIATARTELTAAKSRLKAGL